MNSRIWAICCTCCATATYSLTSEQPWVVTLLACAAVGARVYAFEPAPAAHDRLVENVRLNRMEDRVTCLNVGVGNAEQTVRFTTGFDVTNHVATRADKQNTIEVRTLTLDSVLQDALPALLKIDVEGFEMPVLEGARDVLQRNSLHSVIMELNGSEAHYGHDESRIVHIMLEYGFRSYSYDPLERKPKDLRGKTVRHGNTLFIRNMSFVEERIASAHKVSIFGREF